MNNLAPMAALVAALAGATTANAVVAQTPGPATSSPGRAAQSQKTVWDGVFSDEQVKRGEALYMKSCSVCHRNDLTGTTSDGPPLKGLDFFIRWRGQTIDEMLEEIRVLMPLNDPGSLSPQTYTDIIGFLFKSNGVPMGATPDLTAEPEKLQQILVTEKPAR